MRIQVNVEKEAPAKSLCPCGNAWGVFHVTVLADQHIARSRQALCGTCLHEGSFQELDLEAAPAPPPLPIKRMRKTSQRNERRVAKVVGGQTMPGSGNIPGLGGDVRKRGEFRIEVKDSFSRQYILKTVTLDKIRSECGRNEKPVLVTTFRDRSTHAERETWVTIPLQDWEALIARVDR